MKKIPLLIISSSLIIPPIPIIPKWYNHFSSVEFHFLPILSIVCSDFVLMFYLTLLLSSTLPTSFIANSFTLPVWAPIIPIIKVISFLNIIPFQLRPCLYLNSSFLSVEFPENTGLQLGGGDLAVSQYHWENPANIEPPEGYKFVLRLEYEVDFDLISLQSNLEYILQRSILDDMYRFNLLPTLFPLYQELLPLWCDTNEISIVAGISTVISSGIYLPVSGQIRMIVPYVCDHLDKMKLLVEYQNKTKSLYRVTPSQRSLLSLHIPTKTFGHCGPFNSGYEYHESLGHVGPNDDNIKIWTKKCKVMKKHVQFQIRCEFNNPHEEFITGRCLYILYWIPETPIPFDLEKQLTRE